MKRRNEIKLDFRIISKLEPRYLPISICKSQIAPACRGKFIKSFKKQTSCLHCIYHYAKN